ncbi:MAG: hypothetical protein ACFFB3_09770 [Candidatus Hodarchaeota archaeon]
MDQRTKSLQRQIRDFGIWTNTNIRAWAIFDENGLPLFMESEDNYMVDLEVALGAVTSRIDDIVRSSDDYGIEIRLATLELKETRDKFHYFRMGDRSLVIITAYKVSGEEKFLENVNSYIERLDKSIR